MCSVSCTTGSAPTYLTLLVIGPVLQVAASLQTRVSHWPYPPRWLCLLQGDSMPSGWSISQVLSSRLSLSAGWECTLELDCPKPYPPSWGMWYSTYTIQVGSMPSCSSISHALCPVSYLCASAGWQNAFRPECLAGPTFDVGCVLPGFFLQVDIRPSELRVL